ncbi:MAG: hypothetical protein IT463_07680 [Planctomycetes bacterium]|nr:hypothetical protein [Planctomycetota bacterium]
MAEAANVLQRRQISFRALVSATVARLVRRGFFRLVLLGFLLFVVAPLVALNVLATSGAANALADEGVSGIFDTSVCDVTWDRGRTVFTGPGVTLEGEIAYHDVHVTRKGGATPHPERAPLAYDFVRIPEVRIHYDLKRLPSLPVDVIEFPAGLDLHFNIHKGDWLDADFFKAGEGGGSPPTLPQIQVGGRARVFLRADGVLVPPESLPTRPEGEPKDWYVLALDKLGLGPSLGVRDQFDLSGRASGVPFGDFDLGGTVRRDGSRTEVRFRTRQQFRFDPAFASVLADDVRATVDQFQIRARADIDASLLIEPGRDLQFEAKLGLTQGQLCFVGFPVQCRDCTGDVIVRNNNITVEAQGFRHGAPVTVSATADAVGSPAELVQVRVSIRDLMVDESFRLALLPARLQPENADDWETGTPWPEDQFDPRNADMAYVPGFPEWTGLPTWDGGLLDPKVDPILPFVCRAFTPMGLANFELNLRSEAKGRAPDGRRTIDEQLNWRVFIRSATACYSGLPEYEKDGFPVPIHQAYGVVEGSSRTGQPGRYVVRGYTPEELAGLGREAAEGLAPHAERGLTGTLNGPGERVWVWAQFIDEVSSARRPKLTLKLESDGVDFDQDFEARLPVVVRDVVRQFAPSGKVDIQRAELSLVPQGDSDVAYQFQLTARSVAAEFRFPDAPEPLKFREVAGTILVDSLGGRVRLSNVRGKLLGSPLQLELLYAENGLPSFRVYSDEFELKPELDRMLPPAVGTVLRRFRLHGYVQIEVAGRRDTSLPDFTEADISFLAGTGDRSGSLQFDLLPYPLSDVRGRVFVTVGPDTAQVVLRSLGGRGSEDPDTREKAQVSISGSVIVPLVKRPDGTEAPPVYDVWIEAARVPVDESLLSAMTPMLQDTPAEKPAVVAFVEDLRVTGTVGVSGRVISDPAGNFDWRLDVSLEGTGINYTAFPFPIRDLYGAVQIDGREISLRNVAGRAEGGRVILHQAGFTEAEGWSVSLSAREMSFHATPTLRRALPERLRAVFGRLNPQGEFDIDLELSGAGEFMRYDFSIDVYRTDLDLGLHFDDMTARFDYEGAIDGEHTRQNGSVYVKEVFFKKARFSEVTSAVQHFDDRLEFPNLRGQFYDGWLQGRFGMEGDRYSGEIAIRRGNLRDLGKTAFGTDNIAGALDAEVRFHSWIDSNGAIGRGRIDVGPGDFTADRKDNPECKLAAVPLFDAIFRAAGGEQNFDEGHLYFWLLPERISIREMDFVSNAARVETFGGDDANYISYGDAQMRMKLFFTIAPRSPIPLPLIQQALDLLKQILFPLYVTGTLNEPKVEPFSLSAEQREAAAEHFPRRPSGP